MLYRKHGLNINVLEIKGQKATREAEKETSRWMRDDKNVWKSKKSCYM